MTDPVLASPRFLAPRVLHVSQPTDGGVARCVADLAGDQVARGWRCFVACPPATPLASAVRAVGGVHVPWVASRSPRAGLARELATLARAVRRVDPDVVHLHSSKAGLVGRLAVRGRRPTIFQPHAWSFHAAGRSEAAASIAWERFAARFATVILCVSEGERREGIDRGIVGDLRVVRNGVDLDRYAPLRDGSRADVRRALGLPPDASLVVTPGRLAKQKGQDLVVRAWPGVVAEHRDARLVLVGDGPLRPSLERVADGSVSIVGNRPDVVRWLQAADLVVLPSRWEGMSLAMLEAMATGRSVVATAVAGVDDALGEGAGAIVPQGDVRRLRDEIAARLANPAIAEAEGALGRTLAEARFDVRRMRDAIVQVYRDVLGGAEISVRSSSRTSTTPSSG
jgi:glycosyltransferase involved in cell wall biosynthesis